MTQGNGSEGPFTAALNRELAKYDRLVSRLVREARLQFVANYQKGKRGWDESLKTWVEAYGVDPLDEAIKEILECRTARTHGDEWMELGDAFNFLVFEAAASGLTAPEPAHV